jgi:hypothetical protein
MVNMVDWRRLLVGSLAVSVVFCATALWVLFHYDASNSAVSPGAIVANTLSNPVFWILSVVAFAMSYRLAA